jgi:serine/threonine-protein kinase
MRPDDPDRTKVALLDPLVGKVIAGRYRIELNIAAGGFGTIFRALDLESGRDVAIKLLHPKLTSDPAVIARFRREGAALGRLRDPHTVTAYDMGTTSDGALYIAMELLQGESLYQTFKELGALPWKRVVAIARAVCSSLAEAHALGIVHRDLKPANIHLEERGDERDYVKVLDFGIAKIIRGDTEIDNSDLTHAGQMIGTFDYMPPEQMVGGECTGQSDVFTLGVVMYEVIVGERPFGDPPTAASMLAALLSKTPIPPSVRAEVPPDLDRVILRCLDRNPIARFTVTQLAAELDRLLGGEDNTRFVDSGSLRSTTAKMDAMPGETDSNEGGATRIAPPPIMDEEHIITLEPDPITPDQALRDTRPTPKQKFIPTQTLPGIIPPKKKR